MRYRAASSSHAAAGYIAKELELTPNASLLLTVAIGPVSVQVPTDKRRTLVDSATTIWLVLAMLAHAPLTNLLFGCLQCEWFDDIAVLKRDRSLSCGDEPICLVTAGIFLPLFTIGFPVYMLIRLASFSTSWGQARLKRQQGDQYDATVGTYRRQFNFFVSKCMPHAFSQGTSRDQPVHAPHGPLTCRR